MNRITSSSTSPRRKRFRGCKTQHANLLVFSKQKHLKVSGCQKAAHISLKIPFQRFDLQQKSTAHQRPQTRKDKVGGFFSHQWSQLSTLSVASFTHLRKPCPWKQEIAGFRCRHVLWDPWCVFTCSGPKAEKGALMSQNRFCGVWLKMPWFYIYKLFFAKNLSTLLGLRWIGQRIFWHTQIVNFTNFRWMHFHISKIFGHISLVMCRVSGDFPITNKKVPQTKKTLPNLHFSIFCFSTIFFCHISVMCLFLVIFRRGIGAHLQQALQ